MSKEFKLATEWDVTKEKIKMLLWVIGGFLYGYFVILGKSIFWYSEMVGGINRPQFTIKYNVESCESLILTESSDLG